LNNKTGSENLRMNSASCTRSSVQQTGARRHLYNFTQCFCV